MNGSDARSARETLGLTREQLAGDLNVTPSAVAAWEDGRIGIPRDIATDLAWRAAMYERQVALSQSRLPTCTWIEALESERIPSDLTEQSKRLDRLEEHAKTCDVCAARERFIVERFPPMPPAPRPGWLAVVIPIADWIRGLPRWARPPAAGAALFVAYSLLKLLIQLPTFVRAGRQGLLTAIEGIVVSAAIGAVVGFVYGEYRRRRDFATSPDVKAALEILDTEMSQLRAQGKGGGAVYDAYHRQRQEILKGKIAAADLRRTPAGPAAAPGPPNGR